MIVYGKSYSDIAVEAVARGLKARMAGKHALSLSELRIRVAIAGQLEQAALDAEADWAGKAHELTALCAQSFVACLLKCRPEWMGAEIHAKSIGLADLIEQRAAREAALRIKVPEGFAWYALYPDAYARAALNWARTRHPTLRVAVIGLRSIGTTLAAIVTACLRTRGFEVSCITVRPSGHPFRRCVELPSSFTLPDAAIVVDEGPGLSGSSMAAVATALVERGLGEHAISLFPGHANGPGAKASNAVQHWWRRADIQVTEFQDLELCDCTLPKALLGAVPCTVAGELTELGGGAWMDYANVSARNAHAVVPRLEAPKCLAKGQDGAVLWKFAGFCLAPSQENGGLLTMSETMAARLAELAEHGLARPSIASAHGWLATDWIDGVRLTIEDRDPANLTQMARYIRGAARSPMSEAAAFAAIQRLSTILVQNSEELLGAKGKGEAQRASDVLLHDTRLAELSRYADGRLAPHEWLLTPEGRLVKTDAGGHDLDHTAVGPQSVLWDAAGLIVEWDLSMRAAADLLEALELSPTFRLPLASYAAAYAAFRAGSASLGSVAGNEQATAYYRRRLEVELSNVACVVG
jgi:hypothetical protein